MSSVKISGRVIASAIPGNLLASRPNSPPESALIISSTDKKACRSISPNNKPISMMPLLKSTKLVKVISEPIASIHKDLSLNPSAKPLKNSLLAPKSVLGPSSSLTKTSLVEQSSKSKTRSKTQHFNKEPYPELTTIRTPHRYNTRAMNKGKPLDSSISDKKFSSLEVTCPQNQNILLPAVTSPPCSPARVAKPSSFSSPNIYSNLCDLAETDDVEVATLPVSSLKPGAVALAPLDSSCELPTNISPGTLLDHGSVLNSYSTTTIPVSPTSALLPQEESSSTDVLIPVSADVPDCTSPLSLLPVAFSQHT